MKTANYTYILRCSDGTLYTGWTNDLEKRVASHNDGTGGKYTRARRPVELVYYETFETKQEAMVVKTYEALIAVDPNNDEALNSLVEIYEKMRSVSS